MPAAQPEPQRPRLWRQRRPATPDPRRPSQMEAGTGQRAQSLRADGISRRHKDANRSAEHVFEIGTTIGYALCQMRSTGELQATVRFVVIITVEHDFKASHRDTCTEIVNEWLVRV